MPVARVRDPRSGPTGTAPIPVVGGPASRTPTADPRLRDAPEPAPATEPIRRAAQAPVLPAPRPAPPAPRSSRRRGFASVLAALAVLGLGLVEALPAVAGESAAAPPVVGVQDGDDVQQLTVGGDVTAPGGSVDGVTGSAAAAAAAAGGVTVSGGWMQPVRARLGDPYGPRPQQPVAGVNLFHRGQDLVAPCGTAIRAAADGTVQTASWWGTYGNWVLVDHGHGVATGYAHAERMLVSPGQHVHEGQTIALVGQTGAATGCHLHLEVHLNGVAVNPVPFFAAKGVPLGR